MRHDEHDVEYAVTVRDVSKNYGDVEALKDLSLDFPRGQLTSLLGPSGCGKTTLLKVQRHHHLQPLNRGLPKYVCRYLLDHPAGGSLSELAGENRTPSIQRKRPWLCLRLGPNHATRRA